MASASEPTGTLATRLQAAVQARGQRWTEQRQLIADVLAASDGHATGAELVERVRAADLRLGTVGEQSGFGAAFQRFPDAHAGRAEG